MASVPVPSALQQVSARMPPNLVTEDSALRGDTVIGRNHSRFVRSKMGRDVGLSSPPLDTYERSTVK